jgi:methylglutaconyl-CoA hydratase
MADLVLVESPREGVALVTLNRPERRNALSIGLLEALCAAVERLEQEAVHRVLLLRGAGPVFSAGLDLQEAADPALARHSAGCVERSLQTLRESPLVSVAVVHGGAYAGGAGLMAACDLAIAADDARFGFPEARRGLIPALIGLVLQHKVREGDLRELFLVGETVSALRAQQLGLVQRVVPAAELLDEALHVAESVLRGGPETIRLTKQLLNTLYHEPGEPRLHELHMQARQGPEAQEGLAAFLEKREPKWN